jgi:hypothetical protein
MLSDIPDRKEFTMISTNELLEKANSHVVEVSKLMGEVQELEKAITDAKESDICFQNGSSKTFITVLGANKMQEIKEAVLAEMMGARNTKAGVLLSMIEKRKPANINPDFEAAGQRMEQQGKPDSIEEKPGKILQKEEDRLGQPTEILEEELPRSLTADEILRQDIDKVRELYEDDSVKVTEIAAKYGVKKGEVYTFASKNHFTRIKKPSGFLDSDLKPRRERP